MSSTNRKIMKKYISPLYSLNRSHTEETENAVINANLTAPQTEPSPLEEEQLQADTKFTLSFLEVSALSQDPVR